MLFWLTANKFWSSFQHPKCLLEQRLKIQWNLIQSRRADELHANVVFMQTSGHLEKIPLFCSGKSLQQVWSKGLGAFAEWRNHWCFRSPCSSKDDLDQARPEIGIGRSHIVCPKTRSALYHLLCARQCRCHYWWCERWHSKIASLQVVLCLSFVFALDILTVASQLQD